MFWPVGLTPQRVAFSLALNQAKRLAWDAFAGVISRSIQE
jgi:hypothetical protein